MTFYELEKKCKQLRIKKFFLYFISIIILFGLGFLVYKNIYLEKNSKIKKVEINKTKQIQIYKPETKEKSKQQYKQLKIKQVQKNEIKKTTLTPIIDLNISINEPKKVKPKIQNQSKEIKIQQLKKQKEVKKPVIKVQSLPSFSTCIKLAKMYYEKKDYKNALKWAKYANIQNKNDIRSWLITAKSLFALGKKEKALIVLKTYYQFKPDERIKQLLLKYSQ
jgi:tetratricopeptide (TPR) repeat protein